MPGAKVDLDVFKLRKVTSRGIVTLWLMQTIDK
jgi:hypothetical protein